MGMCNFAGPPKSVAMGTEVKDNITVVWVDPEAKVHYVTQLIDGLYVCICPTGMR